PAPFVRMLFPPHLTGTKMPPIPVLPPASAAASRVADSDTALPAVRPAHCTPPIHSGRPVRSVHTSAVRAHGPPYEPSHIPVLPHDTARCPQGRSAPSPRHVPAKLPALPAASSPCLVPTEWTVPPPASDAAPADSEEQAPPLPAVPVRAPTAPLPAAAVPVSASTIHTR